MMLKEMIVQDLFSKERDHLNYFFDHLDLDLVEAIFQMLRDCEGIIFLTGVGKSGIIAKKIATTMVSTGTRALYISPMDAVHGDLGIVSDRDIFLMISKSGETEELLNLVRYVRNKGAQPVAIVSKIQSRLARACGLAVELPLKEELCPFGLAPTTSTTCQLLFGDVLTVALMRAKNFTIDDYARNHPCGNIGKRITLKVEDLMLGHEKIPWCRLGDKLGDVLADFSNKQCGCVLVIDDDRHLLGIFTDGDLRRTLQGRGTGLLEIKMSELMTSNPKWISPQALAWEAMKLMEADQDHPITVLPVLNEDRCVLGLIKMHDILQSGL